MRRLRTCAAWMFCLGCGEPLVVPVDVTLGDANVAHLARDGAAETLGETPEGGPDDTGLSHVDAAHEDAGHEDAGAELGANCYLLPDPVLSVTLGGDSGLSSTGSDVVSINTDDGLGCGLIGDAGPSLEENPNALDAGGGGDGSNTISHANYQRLDSEPMLIAGRSYALSVPADITPLSLNVLVAGVYGGNVPCAETEKLGNIFASPLGGSRCINLSPKHNARFLRLPIAMSSILLSTDLQLCQTTCEQLGQ